jgi:hypothetical protein
MKLQIYTLRFCSVLCGSLVFSCSVTNVWDEPSVSIFMVEVNMVSAYSSVASTFTAFYPEDALSVFSLSLPLKPDI